MTKTCKWHECSAQFTPKLNQQYFCSKSCKISRAAWRAARGSTLVDILLTGDAADIVAAKIKLKNEIKENTP